MASSPFSSVTLQNTRISQYLEHYKGKDAFNLWIGDFRCLIDADLKGKFCSSSVLINEDEFTNSDQVSFLKTLV